VAENPKKDSKIPSMLEISEMVDKIQRQLNPLSFGGKTIDSIMPRMAKYEQMNSATSIADIARKAVQPVDFVSSSVVDHSAIAMNAQLRVPKAVNVQDTFLEMTKGMSAYDNSLMSARESLIQSTGGTSVYEDMISSLNLIRDSLEPYRSAFDAARTSFEASESFKLARELQSQVALANSTLSKYSGVFEQFESLRNLEYFQLIFKLNDFQFEEVVSTNLTQGDITRFTEKPISEIESDLSDEIKSGKGFSLYSDQDKKYLSYIYHYYLLPLFFGYLFLNMSNILQAKEESKLMETKQEIRSFIRSSHTAFDRQALKGHRFVMVDLLNFRDRPSMSSNVIDSLPIGTTVRVINKSDRSWLLVEVEINGELEQGWVLRRYTTYFK
jgi:hypothetical protein